MLTPFAAPALFMRPISLQDVSSSMYRSSVEQCGSTLLLTLRWAFHRMPCKLLHATIPALCSNAVQFIHFA